jgi:hypothetical protein
MDSEPRRDPDVPAPQARCVALDDELRSLISHLDAGGSERRP